MKWFRVLLTGVLTGELCAMTLSGTHDPDTHNVYSAGYPTSPVRNTSSSFVGLGRDLTQVAWSASGPTKSFAMVSPEHYLTARHFGGASTLKIFGADGQLHSRDQWKTENTNLGVVFSGNTNGDLSLGTLFRPFPLSGLPIRLGLLDLHDRSDTDTPLNYNGQPLHIFGRGPDGSTSPRLAETSLSSTTISGNQHYFTYSRNIVKLEGGDSGSPTFAVWTNPNGNPEHAILGNHAAINTEAGINFDNLAVSRNVILSLNSFLNDEGRSLRLVGNPALNWAGHDSTGISTAGSWGYRGAPPPEDGYVRFLGDQAGNNRVVTIDSSFFLRGLYFTSTGGSSLGFTFQGTSTLEIGRGGLTNYDTSTQTFTAPIQLLHDQYWDVGPGGVEVQNLDTNGHHLEWGGTGTVTVSGTVSGGGSLAIDQGVWIQNGNATYTGGTWIHEATAHIHQDLSSSPAVHLAEAGTLSGSGTVAIIQGNGTLSPGPGPAILSAAQLAPGSGLNLDLEFTAGQPTYSSPTSSGNDLLRLTAATPFNGALDAQSTIRVYLNTGAAPAYEDVFLGGVFTDTSDDFLSSVSSAELKIYVADGSGPVTFESQSYSLYTGNGDWELTTIDQAADFGGGLVNGRILRLRLLPPVGTYRRWTYEVFPESVPLSNRDSDDIPNAKNLENRYAYAFELDPLNPDVTLLPYGRVQNGDLELFYRKRAGDSEVTYHFDTTTSLTHTWTEETLSPVMVDPDPDGTGTVSLMKVSRPIGNEDLLFLRVRTPLTL